MHAIRIDAPGHCRVVEVDPPRPGPGQILLQIERVAFCGTDLSTFQGRNPLVHEPRIIGHELAARIADWGDGVHGFQRGQAVTAMPYRACGTCPACRKQRPNACRANATLGVQRDGAMAEFVVVAASDVLPAEELDAATRASIEPLTIGFHAMARAEVTASDTVLVIGCGMIGLGAIAGATARGARVLAHDLAADKLAIAATFGAEPLADPAQIAALTAGDGPNVVIEAVGSAATYQLALECVAYAGRVVAIGYAKTAVPLDTSLIVRKELDVRGSRNALPADFQAVIAALRTNQLPTASCVSRTVTWEEAPAALAAWSADPGAATRIHVVF